MAKKKEPAKPEAPEKESAPVEPAKKEPDKKETKKMAPAEVGSIEHLQEPNSRIEPSPGQLAAIKTEDGKSAFIVEANARTHGDADGGPSCVFSVTTIDPFLLEELLDASKKVQKIGDKAHAAGKWTPGMLEDMKVAVIDVFERDYMNAVWDQFEKSLSVIAEYAMIKRVNVLECARLRELIQSRKPRKS